MSWSFYRDLGGGRFRECWGLAFEDFREGQVFRHRPGLTVSQQDNYEEAADTMNGAMVHFDAAYAGVTEFRTPLMVSTLTVQRLIGMSWKTFTNRLRIRGWTDLAMTQPVFGGDTLYAQTRVDRVHDAGPASGGLTLTTTGTNQRGETVCRMVYDVDVRRRATIEEGGAAPGPFASHRPEADGAWVELVGIPFEDFSVGQFFEHRPGRTLSLEEVRQHVRRSLDHDAAFSDLTTPAQPVPETLVLGLTAALSTKTFGRVTANLGWQPIAMGTPVRPDDTILVTSEVLGKRDSKSRPDQGIMHVATRAKNQHGEEVCFYERKFLIYRTGSGPHVEAGY